MQKFATPAPIFAVLGIPAGRIRFIAADRAGTDVEILPADASNGRDVKAAERTEVAYADGVLRIGVSEAKNRILGDSGSVEVTVHLPAGRLWGLGCGAACRAVRAFRVSGSSPRSCVPRVGFPAPSAHSHGTLPPGTPGLPRRPCTALAYPLARAVCRIVRGSHGMLPLVRAVCRAGENPE
ncbi:hypothetical protein ABZX98_29425, partial [Streptomyces sp. NPDC002992]